MNKYSEKVKVVIDPPPGFNEGPKPAPDDIRQKFYEAGWTDDPGTGKAVLTEDGREILNPVPMAPPVGYVAEPSMMDIIEKKIKNHLKLLEDGMVLEESEEEANDFDYEEEFDPFSLYEIVEMNDTAPDLPKEPVTPPAPPEPEAPAEILPPEK